MVKLVVENLCLERAGQRIINDVSFELAPGEAMIVTGENGAGKSTLLRGIAGLLPIASGSVGLDGENLADSRVSEYCHYLGHKNGMKPTLTVRENLDFWQKYCGEVDLSVEDALDEVDLSHTIDLPFSYLSAGQKRRVAIARLLVSDRPIWILDEPTSGLDAASVEVFSALAQAFCDSEGMLIAATHLPLGMEKAKKLEIGG